MFNVSTASARVAHRIALAKAQHRAAVATRPVRRSSFGETMAVGLGCDRW
jgi:hypothetical protein